MLAFALMLLSGVVSLGSAYFAYRELAWINRELSQLRHGIDQFAGDSAPISLNDGELSALLGDVFQEVSHQTMVLALNELSSMASLARERARALARGMSRIPFLAGGAGALAIIALGRLESSSLTVAGICLGTGFVSSLAAQLFAKRARRAAKTWGDLVETLSRSTEKRWRQVNSAGGEST